MIYCDGPGVGAMRMSEPAMKLVRTLRKQALLAWRMGGVSRRTVYRPATREPFDLQRNAA